jgi:pimeloyl-ACP methyl ester carboxylesterase
MALLVRTLREAVPLMDLSQELTYTYAGEHFRAWSGSVYVPNFQHGVYPYLIEGGQFEVDESGWATISGWSQVAFTFTLPPEGEMPEGGWPVVIYGHGTGGSYQSLIATDSELEVAAALGRAGLAGLSISLPFHGDRNRGEDETISSFNYLNPTSGRCTFRQAAAEQLWLAELLSQQETAFFAEATDGGPGALYARVDPARIGYLGHSHGGEIGAIAAPFFGDRVQAVVLSGTGGGLSLSIVHRKNEDFDIQGILEGVLAFDDTELLSEHHPVVGLVQTLTEVTDPINYAPYWHRWTPSWEGAVPMDVMEFEGLQDEYTPPIATEALAGAAGNPVLEPVAQTSLSQELNPEMRQPSPAIANVRSWSGARVTGGLVQYPQYGHFAMEEDLGAADMYAEFLRSALAGEIPIIEERP